MSQNARELYSRFSHLLQPIRDLTKNWDVDVASQLEEYMEEIEHITISFDEGASSMNFAEAALLIQGSTCVYSKKVEYLYALVYQTLDLIASKRKMAQASSVDDQGKDSDVSFAHKKDQDEFLCLDMVESANIDMDETGHKKFKTADTVPRTPMSLIPLQDLERASSTPLLSKAGEVLGSRVDFKMNTSVVHPSGALLLEPVNQIVFNVKMVNCKEPIPITFDTPAEKVKEMLSLVAKTPIPFGHEDGVGMYDDDGGGDYSVGGGEEEGDTQPLPPLPLGERDTNVTRPTRVRLQPQEKPKDPWQLLDPHDKGSTADCKPFRKGVTYSIPPSLAKEKTRKRKHPSGEGRMAPAEGLARFMQRSIYSCSSLFPKNPLKTPRSSEFEGYFWAEMKNRQQQKQQDNMRLLQMQKEEVLLEQEAAKEEDEDNVEDYRPLGADDDSGPDEGFPDDLYTGEGVESGFEGAFNNYAASDRDIHGNIITMATNAGDAGFQGIEPMVLEEGHRGGRGGPLEPKELNYEDLVRNYVESTMEGMQAYVQETDLSRRVQEWESRIRPVLDTEEQYPVFDIHHYGDSLMDQVHRHTQANSSDGGCVYFRDVMRNAKQYEVSRMFAATLQLANDGKVRIACAGEGEGAVDTMSLTLLTPPLHHKTRLEHQPPSLDTITAEC